MRRDPWERLPKETDKAFASFVKYRDMGSERSLSKLEQVENKNKAWLAVWSGKFDWVERCAAYDNHLDQLLVKDREKRWLKSRERVITLGEGLQATARMGVKSLVMTNEKGESFLKRDLEPSEIVALANSGVKIESEGYGKIADQPQVTIDARRIEQKIQVNINNIEGEDYKDILALERELGFVRKLKPGDNGNGASGNGKH